MAVTRQEDLNLLEKAAKSNKPEDVKEALRCAVNKNCREIGGYEFTAVHRAVFSNRSVASVLINDPNVELNLQDTLGRTPLHLPWRGCVPLMAKSEGKEIPWDVPDKIEQTPLLYWARLGDDTSLRALLKRGESEVKMSKVTIDGFTALHQVVEQDQRFFPRWRPLLSIDLRCKLVGILLKAKKERARKGRQLANLSQEASELESDVLDFVNTQDILKRSALHYIAEEGCVAILDKLLSCFNVKEVKDRVDVKTLDVHGCAPLLLAVQRGHKDMVRGLLKLPGEQIDPNVRATVIASRPRELQDYEENHKQLCRPNLFSKAPDEKYSGTDLTPLHVAVEVNRQFQVAAALLMDERTTMVENERWEMVDKVLRLAEGLDDKTTANELLTKLEDKIPGSNFITNRDLDHLQLLITVAAMKNHHKIIRHILKWKPEVDANFKSKLADDSGLVATPLHLAILGGHVHCVRALLTHLPLDANVEDSSSRTPFQIATESDRKDVMREIKMREIKRLLMERSEVREFVDRLDKEKQLYVDYANGFLAAATLVATVAFASWLQPPQGYTNESDVAVKGHPTIGAFVVFNGLSFFFAIATVLANACVTMPSPQRVFIGTVVEKVRKTFILPYIFFLLSVSCVLVAFTTAGFAVLPPTDRWMMWFITIIGGAVCVPCLGAIIYKLYIIFRLQ